LGGEGEKNGNPERGDPHEKRILKQQKKGRKFHLVRKGKGNSCKGGYSTILKGSGGRKGEKILKSAH